MERAQLACVRVGKGSTEKLSRKMRTTVRDLNEQKGERARLSRKTKTPRVRLPILRPFAAAFVKVPGKVTVGSSSTSGSISSKQISKSLTEPHTIT